MEHKTTREMNEMTLQQILSGIRTMYMMAYQKYGAPGFLRLTDQAYGDQTALNEMLNFVVSESLRHEEKFNDTRDKSDLFNSSLSSAIRNANQTSDTIPVDVTADKEARFEELRAKQITDISTTRSKAEESEEKLEDKLTTARTSISKRLGKTKTGAEDKTTDGTSDFPVDFMGASFSDEARRTKQNTEDGVAENEKSYQTKLVYDDAARGRNSFDWAGDVCM